MIPNNQNQCLIALACATLLFVIVPTIESRQIDADQVVIAIDCGSDQTYISSDGIEYQNDNLYTLNSKVADYTSNQAIAKRTIKYTDDPQLYKTERHSDDNFAYSLPVKSPGVYTLVLKFCELYFTQPNKRVFNVNFGNLVVAHSVDIVKEVGPMAAYDLYIEFERRPDGHFYFKDQLCIAALDAEHYGLIVEFRLIGKDLPKVDAIVLLKGGVAESNQDEYRQLVKNWEDLAAFASEEYHQEKKEKQLKKIQGEFDPTVNYNEVDEESFVQGILAILLSWKGICIFFALNFFYLCLVTAGREPVKKFGFPLMFLLAWFFEKIKKEKTNKKTTVAKEEVEENKDNKKKKNKTD